MRTYRHGPTRAVGAALLGEWPEGETVEAELSQHTSGCTMLRCFRPCDGGFGGFGGGGRGGRSGGGGAFRVYAYPGPAVSASGLTPVSPVFERILSAVRASRYHTDVAARACVLVPNVDTTLVRSRSTHPWRVAQVRSRSINTSRFAHYNALPTL